MTNNQLTDDRLVKILSETQATIMEHNSRCVRGSVEVDARLFETMIMELQERRKAAIDSEPVAWTDEQELRDVDRGGCGYLFTVNPVTPHADERRIILLYRHAQQPAPVVPEDIPDSVYDILCQACGGKAWMYEEALWNACRAAVLQAGNCREYSNSSTNNCREIAETSTNRSREHFISLCNEFWNWSEMDLVCADDRSYELRMEWDGKVFNHPVTQALWRMYQVAPGNSPVIPGGLIGAVNRLLDSDGSRGCYSAIRCGDAHDEIERLLAAVPQEVKP